jgi:hypothetical protein
VNENAVELGGVGEAIPVALLHLPGLVRVEEKVAACGAA